MFSETIFLMVFGLGAACILLGFFLVARNVGAADGESAVKVIGIEIRASKVGPGVLFALFGLVLVVTALVKLQSPGGSPAPTVTASTPPSDTARVAPPSTPPPQTVAGTAPAASGDLVAALASHNVHGSNGDAALREWTEGGYYRELAEATLGALGPRRLVGNGVDLLKVNYFYLRELGVDDEAKLAAGHVIDPAALQRALVLAHRDMNGGAATSFAAIAQ